MGCVRAEGGGAIANGDAAFELLVGRSYGAGVPDTQCPGAVGAVQIQARPASRPDRIGRDGDRSIEVGRAVEKRPAGRKDTDEFNVGIVKQDAHRAHIPGQQRIEGRSSHAFEISPCPGLDVGQPLLVGDSLGTRC